MTAWNDVLKDEYTKPYYKNLYDFVRHEYETQTVYPPQNLVLEALKLTPYDDVRCVILGQDPYHNPGQAMGLSFSVPDGIEIPPSLQNIYKEIHDEYGYPIPHTGNISKWASEGVLLLNAVLTVRAGAAASHQGHGWEQYTDAVISAVNKKQTPVVFMLWGGFARSKKYLITNPKHLILETSHPSPLSVYRGFLGCGHFKKCNEFLAVHHEPQIDWRIE